MVVRGCEIMCECCKMVYPSFTMLDIYDEEKMIGVLCQNCYMDAVERGEMV